MSSVRNCVIYFIICFFFIFTSTFSKLTYDKQLVLIKISAWMTSAIRFISLLCRCDCSCQTFATLNWFMLTSIDVFYYFETTIDFEILITILFSCFLRNLIYEVIDVFISLNCELRIFNWYLIVDRYDSF